MGQHSFARRHRKAAALIGAATAVIVAVGGAGVASAAGTSYGPQVTTATTVAVNGTNPTTGERARFTVTDDGATITILGTGRNMGGAKDYLSLIYADRACSVPETPSGLTVDGAWQAHGDRTETLFARYDGASYRAVRGRIGSVSVREVTAAVNAGGGNFTLTATARACATLNPGR